MILEQVLIENNFAHIYEPLEVLINIQMDCPHLSTKNVYIEAISSKMRTQRKTLASNDKQVRNFGGKHKTIDKTATKLSGQQVNLNYYKILFYI